MHGLLPEGTKPLPEPMLTYHQLGLVAFIWGKFHRRYYSHHSLVSLKVTYLKLNWNLSGANELTHWGLNKMGNIFHTFPNVVLSRVFSYRFYWGLFLRVKLKISQSSHHCFRLGDGLVPNRQQAITWANYDLVLKHHMAPQGHNELKITSSIVQSFHGTTLRPIIS